MTPYPAVLDPREPSGADADAVAVRVHVAPALLDVEPRLHSVVAVAPASGFASPATLLARVRIAATPFGARVERVADGTLLADFSGRGGARDQAAVAVRCARALRDTVGSGSVAVATGVATHGPEGLRGEVVDRARSLLSGGRDRIAVDAATERLLEAPRAPLGAPTPFVGREAELDVLRGTLESCVRDRSARAALVVAPEGAGKSRLVEEALRAVRERGDVEVWTAHADPMTAGVPFGMLAAVVRAMADVEDGDALRLRRAKLVERLSIHLPAEHVARVAEFLGELARVRFPEARSGPLRAARRCAALMADQVRRAWLDLLAAECAAHPLVLVLEDLHWGDAATVGMLDAALGDLRARPLLVVALARPEIRELFPRLWSDRPLQDLALPPLESAACERVASAVAGARVDERARARLVERAEGNPFILEELLRAALGAPVGDAAPAAATALLQARLERLPRHLRLVLRAVSVFGVAFRRAGVEALLGPGALEGEAGAGDAPLDELVARGLVARGEDGAHVFRGPLLREVAYATVAEADRPPLHALAAAWLERAGEQDALGVAEHYARARDERAGAWYVRAAQRALDTGDLASVVAHVGAALRDGTCTLDDVAPLRVLEAAARRWQGHVVEAEACALDAMHHAPEGSAVWFDAAAELASSASHLFHHDTVAALVHALCAPAHRGVLPRQLLACATAAAPLATAGREDLAARLLERLARDDARESARDPTLAAAVDRAHAALAFHHGELAEGLARTERALEGFDAAGDARRACLQRMNAGYARMMLGDHARAEPTLRAALGAAQRLGLAGVAALTRHNLGLVLALRGSLHEARATETAAVEGALELGDAHVAALSRAYLAQILGMAGNHWGAEREARAALDIIQGDLAASSYAHAVLARALLSTGRVREAIDSSRRAVEEVEAIGAAESEPYARLVYAEALWAAGELPRARLAIAGAALGVRARARCIQDRALRRSFVDDVPVHARTLALAEAWAACRPAC